jgi:hypothetical protein
MKITLIFLFLSFSVALKAKGYQLADSFIEELMCIHNMDEGYCKKWISKGTITLRKNRKIEQGCLNGVHCLILASIHKLKKCII